MMISHLFLRTGCQDREYRFAEVFFCFCFFLTKTFIFLARYFLKICLKNLMGHVLNFPIFLQVFE